EAVRAICTFANEYLRVEVTDAGIFYNPVLHPIESIARLQDGFMNQCIFLRRDVTVLAPVGDHVDDHTGDKEAHPVNPRASGHYPVEVRWVFRRLGDGLPPTLRAAVPKRK